MTLAPQLLRIVSGVLPLTVDLALVLAIALAATAALAAGAARRTRQRGATSTCGDCQFGLGWGGGGGRGGAVGCHIITRAAPRPAHGATTRTQLSASVSLRCSSCS
jgi:hypothetical protein